MIPWIKVYSGYKVSIRCGVSLVQNVGIRVSSIAGLYRKSTRAAGVSRKGAPRAIGVAIRTRS